MNQIAMETIRDALGDCTMSELLEAIAETANDWSCEEYNHRDCEATQKSRDWQKVYERLQKVIEFVDGIEAVYNAEKSGRG